MSSIAFVVFLIAAGIVVYAVLRNYKTTPGANPWERIWGSIVITVSALAAAVAGWFAAAPVPPA
jgi:hypothetical protein